MAGKQDKYSNLLNEQVTMSAANTLTFKELNVGLNIFDKAGLIISRIEYQPQTATFNEMTATGDYVVAALTSSNNLSNLVPNQSEVIDRRVIQRIDGGAAANFVLVDSVMIADFATLPGGGLLVPPKPLYIAAVTNGLANASIIDVRIYFTILRLGDAEYLELLETRRAFG